MIRTVKTDGATITYTLLQSDRRSCEIKVLPDEVRLYAPRSLPLREADGLVKKQADWIRRAQAKFKGYQDQVAALYPMTDGVPVPIEGETYTLRVTKASNDSAMIVGKDIVVRSTDTSPDAVRLVLRRFLIERAMERFHERVEAYVPVIGRRPGMVTIREQKTKWGSCSSKGNLNFNWKLIMAPPEALNYVVIHELCHLYDFNHSDAFWKRVAQVQPDYAVWRDFLRSGWSHPFP